ncbi:uncharacterized protein LOC123549815 isoform X2 [Mercenaria mercenaria]|uniref:uncharacterized protein LOC123549815 isoform X2 n=1 Tax=Mercenaria mercenaria TaxID=6596 RepID=UPI00234E9ACC|nr:uncharacterized protein LOC123549815 isoform X2 [Mercenaria mercenaria]
MSPSETCGERCPFLPPKKEKDIKPTEESSKVVAATMDSKYTFGLMAAIAIFIVIAISAIGLYCYCKYRHKNALTPSNSQETMPKVPVNDVIVSLGVQESEENLREEAKEDIPSPPESGADAEEHTPFLPGTGTKPNEHIPYLPEPEAAVETDEHIPFVPGTGNVADEHIPSFHTENVNDNMEPSVTSGEHNDFGEGFSISFSKVRELEANGHTFTEPEFQSVH